MKILNTFLLGKLPSMHLSAIRSVAILFLITVFSISNNYAQGDATIDNELRITLDGDSPLQSNYVVELSNTNNLQTTDYEEFLNLLSDNTIKFIPKLSSGRIIVQIIDSSPANVPWTTEDWNDHIEKKTNRALVVMSNN